MKIILFSLLLAVFNISFAGNCSDVLFKGYTPKVKGNSEFICKGGFAVLYDSTKKRPIAAMERMNPGTIKMSILLRKDNFRPEPSINPNLQPAVKAFVGTGFDKGHLVSAEDMSFYPDFVNDTYVMINIVPQFENHNRGIWKALEMRTRKLASQDEIFVVSGPIYSKTPTILDDGTPIPSFLYKIIVRPSTSASYCFLIPHAQSLSSKDPNKYTCLVKDILVQSPITRMFPINSKLIEKHGI